MTDTFRELCTEVLAFHHGEGCYNFSGLNPYDRDNAAFDAWQDIRQRLKSALAQPAPAPAVPEAGEVGDLVAWLLRLRDNSTGIATQYDEKLTRAATMIQQLSAPAPPAAPAGGLVERVADAIGNADYDDLPPADLNRIAVPWLISGGRHD
jgi:hypothetical protein